MEISKRQADQIINTLKSVVNEDVNFIYPNGIIIASSNKDRVGTYHEGATIVAKTNKPLIVDDNDVYEGTIKGINLPVYFEDDLVAIVGITVNDKFDEIMKLTTIVVKMSEILIKEQFLNTQKQFKRENNRIIFEMIMDDRVLIDEIVTKMDQLGYDSGIFRYVVVCELDSVDNVDIDLSNVIYNSIEKRIDYKDLITKSQNNYIILSRQDDINVLKKNLASIQEYVYHKYKISLTVGISERFADIYHLRQGYKQALMVVQVSSVKGKKTINQFEPSSVEFLFFGFSEHLKNSFSKAILEKIPAKEKQYFKQILLSYIKNNGSIMKTSQELFIHKNTLQYKLNKIRKITGYNPREISDLIVLYLAIELDRH